MYATPLTDALRIAPDEGDACRLPYDDDTFDVAMTAHRPRTGSSKSVCGIRGACLPIVPGSSGA